MATVRFIHSSDWQLGITRDYLSQEAQARFAQARLDAIRAIGRVAEDERCEFVVVCGDVFETNHVERQTVNRALDALAAVPVPVYLLPGNHDPLEAATVFRSPTFLDRRPAHVHVIEDSRPIGVRPGVELVGAPWTSKRPLRDLVAAASADLEPTAGTIRIALAHGAVDALSPDRSNPALIGLEAAEAALTAGKIHYLALGDRHSLTRVGTTERIWYAGTPEPTDFVEDNPGHVLVVEAGPDTISVTPRRVSTWRYLLRERVDLNTEADLEQLQSRLQAIEAKDRTIVKLGLVGTVPLRLKARFDRFLEESRDLFGAIEIWGRASELAVVPDDEDFSGIDLSGFAAAALARLRERAGAPGDDAIVARDALSLLVRLSGRAA